MSNKYEEKFNNLIFSDEHTTVQKGAEICSAPLRALNLINEQQKKIAELESALDNINSSHYIMSKANKEQRERFKKIYNDTYSEDNKVMSRIREQSEEGMSGAMGGLEF